ncbi:Helix-turn-helix [Pedobacter westerhofensis]|uniref:Helix-turn-helix n=1 Tax=Pedobacter westerhofensis TaxID=425512 RepID=A0A521FN59_9SPHI|nr:Helix-turn-helix [Pedobacter westerhofensis]
MDRNIELKVKNVVNNIKRVRKYRNYTQQYVAAKLSISQNTYSKIELGITGLTLECLFQIAVVLDVKVDWLLTIERPTGKDMDSHATLHLIM